jgi:hypothetical protein
MEFLAFCDFLPLQDIYGHINMPQNLLGKLQFICVFQPTLSIWQPGARYGFAGYCSRLGVSSSIENKSNKNTFCHGK